MICCGHILSNPFKEEVLPDPGRLAMNRHQSVEDMDKTGNYEDYVSKWLFVLQRQPGMDTERDKVCVCVRACM